MDTKYCRFSMKRGCNLICFFGWQARKSLLYCR
nr:MAG TPA: hypothetical protein [Caudoviricetes sp.]